MRPLRLLLPLLAALSGPALADDLPPAIAAQLPPGYEPMIAREGPAPLSAGRAQR